MAPIYLHLRPGDNPPSIGGFGAFKAVVVSEAETSPEWQSLLSDWLVRSGCRYMMAWGLKCRDWHDSVDEANLTRFADAEISDDDLVMTTWHEAESLQETFWFSVRSAMHPSVELERTYVVHIAPVERSAEILKTFQDAQNE